MATAAFLVAAPEVLEEVAVPVGVEPAEEEMVAEVVELDSPGSIAAAYEAQVALAATTGQVESMQMDWSPAG